MSLCVCALAWSSPEKMMRMMSFTLVMQQFALADEEDEEEDDEEEEEEEDEEEESSAKPRMPVWVA